MTTTRCCPVHMCCCNRAKASKSGSGILLNFKLEFTSSLFCSSEKGHKTEKSGPAIDKLGNRYHYACGERTRRVLDTSVRFAPSVCFMTLPGPKSCSVHRISVAKSYGIKELQVYSKPCRYLVFSFSVRWRFEENIMKSHVRTFIFFVLLELSTMPRIFLAECTYMSSFS